jgi:hypothetical protein
MKLVTLKLTTKELESLATPVADQLFRKEFIEPKMPGYKSNGRRDESRQDIDRAPSIHAGPGSCEENDESENFGTHAASRIRMPDAI